MIRPAPHTPRLRRSSPRELRALLPALWLIACGSRIEPADLPEALPPGEAPASVGGEQVSERTEAPVASEGNRLTRASELHRACELAERESRPTLHTLRLPAPPFVPYDPSSGELRVDTRRNLRAFGGSVELFTTELEPIAFVANPSRADELARDATELRVGFFLAFDGGQPCLVRPSSVSTARIDLAFVELLDGEGGVLAREDTERLAAWRDDEVPEPGLSAEGDTAFLAAVEARRAELEACFAAMGEAGQIVLARGERSLRISFSSLEDREAGECVLRALQGSGRGGTLRFQPRQR